MTARAARSAERGMTLIEIMVAIAILAMVAVLIQGVIDSLTRGRKGESAPRILICGSLYLAGKVLAENS